jgi:LCP family protein required for cell wall assembly
VKRSAPGLILLLAAACLPVSKADTGAPRLAKPTDRVLVPIPLSTGTPPAAPTQQPFTDIGWPAPFSYGNPPPPSTPIPPPSPQLTFDREAINILLLGSDRRPDSSSYRTDVLIVVSIHPDKDAVAMLSIPRDLYVYLPGYSMQRINTAFSLGESIGYPGGGPALLADTIRYNLGIPIDHFARVEMDGFSRIVDTLGGVEVNVACPYRDWRLKEPYLNPNVVENWRLYTVPAGVIQMDGDLALWYARSRRLSSDFDRSRRQQEVLRAIYRKVLSFNLIPRLPALYSDLRESVNTDLGLDDLIALAPLSAQIGSADIRSRFIGRDEVTSWRIPVSGAQVLVPKPDPIHALVAEAFDFEAPDELIPEASLAVEVVNGSAEPSWAVLAVERLSYAGFDAHVSPEAVSPAGSTQLIDYGLAPAEAAQAILGAFGLSGGRLLSDPDPGSPFAFRLVVGSDYDPCFDPTRGQLNP